MALLSKLLLLLLTSSVLMAISPASAARTSKLMDLGDKREAKEGERRGSELLSFAQSPVLPNDRVSESY